MKEYTREDIKNFFATKNFKHSELTFELMDSYVACFKPDDIEQWIEACAAFPRVEKEFKKGSDMKIQVKDIQKVRAHFLKTYFPDDTKEAREKAKQQEANRKKSMSDKDKMKEKMDALKRKYQ